MNMNMVMVGRQLEQFKKEKLRIRAKLLAMKKAAKQQSIRPTPSSHQPNPSKLPESYGSWASKVKEELTEMLRDIPVASNKEGKGDSEGAKSSPLGSLWDFRNALDKILPPPLPLHHRQSRASWDCEKSANRISTDAIYIGLSFVDFWLTATSMTDERCIQYEFCQLATENNNIIGDNDILRAIENRLVKGVSFYLSQFHSIPKIQCNGEIKHC